ncbi:MAG TPA: phage holin family protein [Clostridia bacterium]|nr:phage holin family protein [Clostridia bacterium]
MDFLSFLSEQALTLVPVLWVLGALLKKTPKLPNWLIPYILLAAGVLLTCALLGFNVRSLVQGVLVTGAAVFGHQLLKQFSEAKNYFAKK